MASRRCEGRTWRIDGAGLRQVHVGERAGHFPALWRRSGPFRSDESFAGGRALAGKEPRRRDRSPFSLVPPPRDQQFRTAQLKVERSSARRTGVWRPRSRSARPAAHRITPGSPAFGVLPRFATCGAICRRRMRRGFTDSWPASCPARARSRPGMRALRPERGPPGRRDSAGVHPRKRRQVFSDDDWVRAADLSADLSPKNCAACRVCPPARWRE